MDREQPTSASQVDETLQAFYQRYKAEHAPSDQVFQRIFDAIPQADPTTTTAQPAQSSWLGWWRKMWWRWSLAPGLAAVGALFLWWQTGKGAQTFPTQPHNVTKQTFVPKSGEVSFSLLHARRTPQGYLHQQTTRMGERLQAGDGVQLSYQVPHPMYVMLVSLNQQGEVSVFVPFGQATSVSVEAGAGTLPRQSSLTLDHYVGKERFFFLYGQKPFTEREVKQAAQRAFARVHRSLQRMRELPGSWQSKTLLIEKIAKE